MKISEFKFRGACCENGIDRANHIARVEGEADPQTIVKAVTKADFEVSFIQVVCARIHS